MSGPKGRLETTPFVEITTDAAFPERKLPDDPNAAVGDVVTEEAHPTEKVVLSWCSELSNATAPVTLFDARHKLRLFQDSSAQALVFTVGTDERLYCLLYVTNLREGWRAVDITPGDASTKIVAFDATEVDDALHIAVAGWRNGGDKVIFHAAIKKPTLKADKLELQGFDAAALEWQSITNNLGSKDITTVTCLVSKHLQLAVGTAQTDKLSASHYLVDVNDTDSRWRDVPMPTTAKKIIALSGGRFSLTEENAIFTLFENDSKRRIVADIIDQPTKTIDYTYRLLPGDIGEAQDMFVNSNSKGWSDLVVAGSKGIGFYDHRKITKMPQMIDALQGISFKQVTSTESGDASSNTSTINILAVSEVGQLYFVEGKRSHSDKTIQFECSGLPIRSDVRLIVARFSGLLDASEVCYAGSGSNEIGHLYRDKTTGSWTSTRISVLSEQKSTSYKAYLTSIHLKNAAGTAVPPGYPVQISSPTPVLVTVNGRSSCIYRTPIEIAADSSGKILITTPATDALCSPIFTLSLLKYNAADSAAGYQLATNQRIINQLGSQAPNSEELKNARDINGNLLFDPVSDFSGAAKVMASFKDLSQSIGGEGNSDINFRNSWEVDDTGKLKQIGQDWMTETFEQVGKVLGDVVECLKSVVKGAVKFGILVVKGAAKLLIKIGGKRMEVILDSIGSLVTGILGAAASLLGSTVKGLLELFGLWPDPTFMKETQQVLADITSTLMSKAILFIDVNESTLEMAAEKLAERARAFVKDTRPKIATSTDKGKDSTLSKILNNPIVQALLKYNPLQWVIEAIEEETSIKLNGFSLPNLRPLLEIFTDILPNLFDAQLQNLQRFIEDVKAKYKLIKEDSSKAFDYLMELMGNLLWTAFDAVKELIFAIYRIIGAVLKQFKIIIEFAMKIPFVSKLFEQETGLDFSIVNIFTYALAFVSCMGRTKNPAVGLRKALKFLQSFTEQDLDIKSKLGWVEPANDFEAQLQAQTQIQKSGEFSMRARDVPEKPSFGLMANEPDNEGLEHFSQISSAITSLSRLCLIWVEVVVPWNDAIYEDRWDTWDPLGAKNPPKHGMKEGSNARLFVDRFSIVFSVLNLLGNIGNVATALAHPHWTCSRFSWCAAAAICSGVCLALDCSHSKKIEEHQGTIIAVISNVGTVFQLLSEEELDPTIKRLHYGGCGAGLVVAIAIAARKKAPLVAIAAGGLALVIDSGVTVFAAVTDIVSPHHGSVHTERHSIEGVTDQEKGGGAHSMKDVKLASQNKEKYNQELR